MDGNTYVQNAGRPLGQYGANEEAEPPVLVFDEHAEDVIRENFGDKNAVVCTLEKA